MVSGRPAVQGEAQKGDRRVIRQSRATGYVRAHVTGAVGLGTHPDDPFSMERYLHRGL